MNIRIKLLFRKYLPEGIQNYLCIYSQDKFLSKLRKDILKYYKRKSKYYKSPEIIDVINFLKYNPLHIYPYNFIKKYKSESVIVFEDNTSGFKYVYHDKKKLFYPKEWSSNDIQYSYSFSCLEQDKHSPHSYQNKSIIFRPNDIVVDAGTAEGNFSLEVVDKVKKVYLFECSAEWENPLKKTFEPWGDKVELIPLKLSSNENTNSTTLDKFFAKRENPTIIKIDVDGDENLLLKGAKNLLKNQEYLKIVLCTYHNKNDEREFTEFLQNLDFEVKTSKGFMIFYPDEPLQEPYLRRGLIFASKGISNI